MLPDIRRVEVVLQPCKDDSCAVGGCFTTCEVEVKERRFSGLEGFADGYDFPSVLFEKLWAPASLPGETLAKSYTLVYNMVSSKRAMRCEFARDLCSQVSDAGKRKLTS